jgi:hypothetical protein
MGKLAALKSAKTYINLVEALKSQDDANRELQNINTQVRVSRV